MFTDLPPSFTFPSLPFLSLTLFLLYILYPAHSFHFPTVFYIYLAGLVSSASYWALSFLKTTFLLVLSLWHHQHIKAAALYIKAIRVKTRPLKLPSDPFPARFDDLAELLKINEWGVIFTAFVCLHLALPPVYSIFAEGPLVQFRVLPSEGEINFVIRSEIPRLYIILLSALLWSSTHEKWMSIQYLTKGHQSGPQPQCQWVRQLHPVTEALFTHEELLKPLCFRPCRGGGGEQWTLPPSQPIAKLDCNSWIWGQTFGSLVGLKFWLQFLQRPLQLASDFRLTGAWT